MDQNLAGTPSAATAATVALDGPNAPATEHDAAGGITLSGRNRACARVRVLAGMVLTSGIVITLTSLDTSVSSPQ